MIKFWRLRTTCIFLSCRFLAGCIARSLGEPRAGKPANSPAGAISRRRGPSKGPRRFLISSISQTRAVSPAQSNRAGAELDSKSSQLRNRSLSPRCKLHQEAVSERHPELSHRNHFRPARITHSWGSGQAPAAAQSTTGY